MPLTPETDRQVRLKAAVDTLLNEIKRLNEDRERLLARCKAIQASKLLHGTHLFVALGNDIAAAEAP